MGRILWYTYVMNKTLTTLVSNLASTSISLQDAKKKFTEASLVLAKTERVLAEKRNLAIVEGKASGSNETQRNASLSILLAEDVKAVDAASDAVTIAKLNVDIASIEHSTIKHSISAYAVEN